MTKPKDVAVEKLLDTLMRLVGSGKTIRSHVGEAAYRAALEEAQRRAPEAYQRHNEPRSRRP